MEFNRNEEVPRLVTKQEVSYSKDARNKLLMQARTQLQPKAHAPDRQHEITTLNDTLHGERREKDELRQAVRDLTSEMHKLRSINDGLIARVKDVEHSYRAVRSEVEKQCED